MTDFCLDTGLGSWTQQALLALANNHNEHWKVGQFLSSCSLFFTEASCRWEGMPGKSSVPNTRSCWAEPKQHPQGWNTPGFMMVISGIRRASFIFKFMFSHQGTNMETGHDSAIRISNPVAQGRCSGLLTVTTVLDHIFHKEGNQITLYSCLDSNGSSRGWQFQARTAGAGQEYAPSARSLNLWGVNSLEHGLFPSCQLLHRAQLRLMVAL